MRSALVLACLLLNAVTSAGAADAESPAKRRTVANPIEAARAAAIRVGPADPASGEGGDETVAHPLPGPIQNGLSWLAAHQNANGSWGQLLPLLETGSVVPTLARLDPGSSALEDGASWLSGQSAANHDFLARQIAALARVPERQSAARTLAEGLLALRNPALADPLLPNWPEGGWGLADGYESDCLTTALALSALDGTGFNGGFKAVGAALSGGATNVHTWTIAPDAVRARILITVAGSTVRLRMTQGAPPTPFDPYFPLPPGGPYQIVFPDSGLPFTPGANFISVESPNPPATPATYTMTASYETPTFDTRTLAEPLEYLRQAQNPDGGWGLQRGQPSEMYTTLHVLLALLRYEPYDLATDVAEAVAHVKALQLGDGSFGLGGPGVPYVTALAAAGLMRSEDCQFGAESEDAIAALETMQAGDGSWDQEPYDTALALLALAEHADDLDADGVREDGDCSGAIGDNACPNGATVGCDDNCPQIANPGQQNADGDLRGDACDCNGASAQAWESPGDVVLALFHYAAFARTEIAWGATANPGGSLPVAYDTLRSTAASDFQGPATCLESNAADTQSTDFDLPAPGSAYYFLVRVENGCPAPGTMGTNSSGVPRLGRSCP